MYNPKTIDKINKNKKEEMNYLSMPHIRNKVSKIMNN